MLISARFILRNGKIQSNFDVFFKLIFYIIEIRKKIRKLKSSKYPEESRIERFKLIIFKLNSNPPPVTGILQELRRSQFEMRPERTTLIVYIIRQPFRRRLIHGF